MAEHFPFSVEEQYSGPDAPAQTLAGWCEDIIAQRGEDHSKEDMLRLYATWEDSEGHSMHLHKIAKDGQTIFRLRVMSLTESAPVASYRYPLNGKGVTMHDRNWERIAGPHRDHEKAMRKYLESADVTLRNGEPNELVNSVFWRIAVGHVLSTPEVIDIQNSIAANAPAVVRYAKMTEAADRVRRHELRVPDDILHQALEGVFFPQQQQPSDEA